MCAPGEYREDRLPGRPCLSCDYSGEFGLQGVARGNATGGGGGVRGVHQNASCQCAKGRYYEGVNRVCLLCEPGTYQDREGLASESLPCDTCHVSTAYGAQACGGCAGSDEYWSKRQRACRPATARHTAHRHTPHATHHTYKTQKVGIIQGYMHAHVRVHMYVCTCACAHVRVHTYSNTAFSFTFLVFLGF